MREWINQDREVVSNYREVLGLIQAPASALKTQIENKQQKKIRIYVLLDHRKVKQGIVSVRVTPKSIYLSCLLSAPWNIHMKGKISENDKPYRKVGTVLVKRCYILAQKLEKESLELTPTTPALVFYQRIGMVRKNKSSETYHFPISHQMPTKLQLKRAKTESKQQSFSRKV